MDVFKRIKAWFHNRAVKKQLRCIDIAMHMSFSDSPSKEVLRKHCAVHMQDVAENMGCTDYKPIYGVDVIKGKKRIYYYH